MGKIIPKIILPVLLLLLVVFISSCDRLSIKKAMAGANYPMIDQYGEEVSFPDSYSGKVILVGYVYTHCPDICPLITYNMRDIQRAMQSEDDFKLISISFDPDRDTPEVLYDYATNFRLDQSSWSMLTGNKNEINNALDDLEIRTLKTPTRFADNGSPQYFIDHTDKVTLIDREGNIRNTYTGSDMDSKEIIEDIHTLLMEDE